MSRPPSESPSGPPEFRPRPWMWAYLYVTFAALSEGRAIPTRQELAERLGVTAATIATGMGKPGFGDWYAREMERLLQPAAVTARIKAKVASQAEQGSLGHQKLWLQLTGDLEPRQQGSTAPTIIIGVPRPTVTSVEELQAWEDEQRRRFTVSHAEEQRLALPVVTRDGDE